MSPITVLLILFAGAVSTALIAAAGLFCWRLLEAIGKLNVTVGALSADQNDFLVEVVTLRGEAAAARGQLRECKAAIMECAAGMSAVHACGEQACKIGASTSTALAEHKVAVRQLTAEAPTFAKIADSLEELDKGIKTFLAVVVNTQVPGAMPADLVAGTPLNGGQSYAYDESFMAEQERIRRKARGESEPETPEVREPEIEIV